MERRVRDFRIRALEGAQTHSSTEKLFTKLISRQIWLCNIRCAPMQMTLRQRQKQAHIGSCVQRVSREL
jgi:hypothetical protein